MKKGGQCAAWHAIAGKCLRGSRKLARTSLSTVRHADKKVDYLFGRSVWSTSLAIMLMASLPGTGFAAADEDVSPDDEAIDEITVLGDRIAGDPPLGFALDEQALGRMPGTQDDPIKAVITLPGVLTNNDFDTGVALRGTRPEDNRYYLDFLPTGYLFHITGLSVVDGDMVARLQLLSAGFGVAYQGVIGGVISANTRDPSADRLSGVIDVSIVDAGLMIEGPITDRQRAAASVRVSYYDVVVGDLVEKRQEEDEQGLDIIQLPRYRDYRLRYQVDAGKRGKLDILVDGAGDDVKFDLGDDSPNAVLDPARAGSYRYDVAYDRQGLVYSQPYDIGKLRFGIGQIQSDVSGEFGDIGKIESKIDETVFRLLNEMSFPGHRLTFGASVSETNLERDLVVRDNGCTEFDVDCLYSDEELETSRVDVRYAQGNVFVEDEIELTSALDLTLGLGHTRDDYLGRSALEPRMRLDWSTSEAVTVSFGAGRYSQLPSFNYTEPNLGNPKLAYLRSDHYVLGINAIIQRGYIGSLNFFYKSIDDLVTSDPAIRYDNGGEGRAWGVELLVRKGLGKLNGWAAVTWSRSFRTDTNTGLTSRFEFDQPLSVSVVAKYDLSDRVSLSGRAAFHSGAPVTPIYGGRPDPNRPDGYLPEYGSLNSERLPSYFRLDLRLDWNTGWRNTLLYFEVINSTDHQNVLKYEFSKDYSERKNLEQLPRFLAFGVKKRF